MTVRTVHAGLVVDVAARVPGARFVIVGGMPNGAAGDPEVDALARRAREAGAADRVDLRGYLPYAQVADELRKASAALLPLFASAEISWVISHLE